MQANNILKTAVLVCVCLGTARAAAVAAELGEQANFKAVIGTIDDACYRRFLAEAPPAWKKLQDDLRGFEVKCTHREDFEFEQKGVKVFDRDKGEWRYCVPTETFRQLVDGGDKISGANERYSFRVQRSSNQSPFVLVECEPWEPGTEQPRSGAILGNESSLHSLWSIWWVRLSLILEQDGFKLITVECATVGNKELVKIAYRYQGPSQPKLGCEPGAIYWAELSPADSWGVLRSGVDGLERGMIRTRTTTELQKFGKGIFPRRVTLEYEQANRLVEIRDTIYQSPQTLQRQTEEFFLPFYGISESSVDILATNQSWRIGLLIAGAIGILAAILILRRFGIGGSSSQK